MAVAPMSMWGASTWRPTDRPFDTGSPTGGVGIQVVKKRTSRLSGVIADTIKYEKLDKMKGNRNMPLVALEYAREYREKKVFSCDEGKLETRETVQAGYLQRDEALTSA